jgi:hypothetical protein
MTALGARRLAAPFFVIALLAGCSDFEAFSTVPEAAAPGQPTGKRVAICYNGMAQSRADIEKAAQLQCGPRTRATSVATDWWMQDCPLLLPGRASFVCTPQK